MSLASSSECESIHLSLSEVNGCDHIISTTLFHSFEHCYASILTDFAAYGMKCRIRDTHWDGLHVEENVIRRKYECCVPGCSWFAWYVKRVSGEVVLNQKYCFQHSHECTPILSVPTPRLPFTEKEKAVMDTCKECGITPVKTKAMMDLTFGRDYVESRIRSYLLKGRKADVTNDIKTFVETLNDLSRQNQLQYSLDVDDDGTLDKVFVMLKEGQDDYDLLGRTVGIDATYDTNRYSLSLVTFIGKDYSGRIHSFCYGFLSNETTTSYTWLLKEFARHVGGTCPEVIISDGDGAIAAAISIVFPETTHRLCTWHLRKNIRKNMRSLDRTFYNRLTHITRIGNKEHAEREFESLVVDHNISHLPYANRLKSMMPKWCEAFLPTRFVGRFRTTQGNESQHSRLKRELSSASTLSDCLRVIQNVKKREMYLEGVPRRRLSLLVLSNLSRSLSSVAIGLLEEEIQQCYQFEGVREVGNSFLIADNGWDYTVSLHETSEKIRTCGCSFRERFGLPCRHMLAVFMKLGQMELMGLHCYPCWFLAKGDHIAPIAQSKIAVQNGDESHERSSSMPCTCEMQLSTYHDANALFKKLFSFSKVEHFRDSVNVVLKTVQGEIDLLGMRRRRSESFSHFIGTNGDGASTEQVQEAFIVRIPRDTTSIGHPTQRRKKSSTEG